MEALEDHLVLGQSAWKNSTQRLRSGEKSIVIIKLWMGRVVSTQRKREEIKQGKERERERGKSKDLKEQQILK